MNYSRCKMGHLQSYGETHSVLRPARPGNSSKKALLIWYVSAYDCASNELSTALTDVVHL